MANLAIFGYEHFGGVEVDALVHCEPLDQGDVRIGLAILPYPDLLDEPVEPQSDRWIGDSVLTRDLLQGTGRK